MYKKYLLLVVLFPVAATVKADIASFRADPQFAVLTAMDVDKIVADKKNPTKAVSDKAAVDLNVYLANITNLLRKHEGAKPGSLTNNWRAALTDAKGAALATDPIVKKVMTAISNVAVSPGTIAQMVDAVGGGKPATPAVPVKTLEEAAEKAIEAMQAVQKKLVGAEPEAVAKLKTSGLKAATQALVKDLP